MITTEDNQRTTLDLLHWVPTAKSFNLADAVMHMAIRYGATCGFECDPSLDQTLVRRARLRRLDALQRLVAALERQS